MNLFLPFTTSEETNLKKLRFKAIGSKMGFDSALSGLLYIGSKKNGNCGYLETVLSWTQHIWGNALQQPSFTPFSRNNNVFDYLEMFEPNDAAFYSQCRNSNMDLKLWEKKGNTLNELLSIPLALQPFYDAFSNPTASSQFSKEKMPIVSFIDWKDIECSSTDALLSAKIQILLAIGTPEQLDNLKHSRRITIPASITSKVEKPNVVVNTTNQTVLADMLSTFIDNLALSLPKRSASEIHQQCPPESQFQLRRTSDLLDVLQNALKNPTPVNLVAPPFKLNGKANTQIAHHQHASAGSVRVLVAIESARNIGQSVKKTTQAKSLGDDLNFNDEKPCTYVSFEANHCDNPYQRSHYFTNVVQYDCNPCWNREYQVILAADSFQKNKCFTVKVWQTTSAKQSHNPTEEDELIGCSTIDVTDLLSGMKITGFHDIIDDTGEAKGEIKITIMPLDINCQGQNKLSTEDDVNLPNNFKDLENDVDNIMLSRTLKRKFTELEEISQRLKSRLLDVTSDENFDIDDEFENDLNTCPEEDDIDSRQEFDWQHFSTLEINCDFGEELIVNKHFNDSSEMRADRVDFLTNALQNSVLNTSSPESKTSPSTDEGISTKIKTTFD